jgi:hypothetical protein
MTVRALPPLLRESLGPKDQERLRTGLGRIRSDPVAAAIALRGWVPHPAQREVLRRLDVREGKVKLGIVNAGTGWGKTDVIAELHSEVAESKKGVACLAASRSQEQANLAIKRLIAYWTSNPVALSMLDDIVYSPYPTVYLKGGSYITARTTKDDCQNLRGPEWDFVTLDEMSFGSEFAWHFLTTRVRKSNGPVIGFSSPQEEWYEDLYNEFDEARLGGDETLYAYSGPATENPWLHPEYFERMKARLPDILYRQEVLAEFVGSNVHTFRKEHLLKIFDAGLPVSTRPVSGHKYGQGWDMGVESTAGVGYVCDVTARDLIIGVHGERHENTTWPHLQRRVETNVRDYRGRKAIDYTGVGNAAGQNLRVHVRPEEKIVFSPTVRYDLCVEAMKFVEEHADRPSGLTSLLLPANGPWAPLRDEMRKHKLSLAKKKDSKSLKDRAGMKWDSLDAFLLMCHAANMALKYSGSRLEAA